MKIKTKTKKLGRTLKIKTKRKNKNILSEENEAKTKTKKLGRTLKIKTKRKNMKILPEENEANADGNESNNDETELPIKQKDNKDKTVSKKTKKPKKSSKKNAFKIHKDELESLKDIDPEFYQFLKQNDKKLLEFNFDDSDDDLESEAEEDAQEGEAASGSGDDEIVHKPTGDLEVASDESDYHDSDGEEEAKIDESKVITLKLLRTWQTELQGKKVHINTIRNAVLAFSSALASISGGQTGSAVYKVEGAAAFNGVIQLCVLYLQRGIHKFLGQHEKAQIALHKCKKWKKIRTPLKTYFLDLSRLVEHVTSGNILAVLLKHLHQVAIMLASFSQISKIILKRLIVLWSTSEETVRVLSFLCILKITRNQQISLLNHVLKAMYLAYVRNSKFVSPNTLPGINFMRRSLVELFALDLNVTYQHAFLYIRQLAIHLRNAVILKKKDSFKAVYNWQYINSIRLWSDLLGATANKSQLEPLVYPLVTVTTAVVKLIPTAQYFPLRFHCIQALISLHKQRNVFIPVLPFILEVLNSNTFNKKHSIASMKPMSFACVLRLNKSQMAENGFRDEVVEQVCGLTLEHLGHESCSLAYPDLIVPAVVALKQYLKVCKNSNYSRKLKQLVDKIVENSKFIEEERRKINFTLKDKNLIQSWETVVRNKGTPLGIYYSSWIKMHEVKRKRQAANTDDINDYDIPMIKRKKVESKEPKEDDGAGPVELFPSGSENEDGSDDNVPRETKKTKKKKAKKERAAVQSHVEEEEDAADGVDIVKDLDLDDW